MARDFRSSRFNTNRDIGEDVNPSAYIVNLADCMLVLACGFLVAMISFWQIDLGPRVEELDSEQLQEVEPEEMNEEIFEGGSYYIEAGKVYLDPNTGQYYIVSPSDEEGNALDGATEASEASETSDAQVQAAPQSNQAAPQSNQTGDNTTLSDDEIRQQRARGGD